MSLYNAIFGVNNMAPLLLKILDIDQPKKDMPILPPEADSWNDNYDPAITKDFVKECIEKKYYISGRFRDIYLNEDGTKILLYTRNGGGNREEYRYVFEILKTHPNYLADNDDDFDCTYVTIEFSVPKEYQEDLKKLANGQKPETVSDKFHRLFADLDAKKKTKETEKAEAVGKKIFGKLDKGEKIIEV